MSQQISQPKRTVNWTETMRDFSPNDTRTYEANHKDTFTIRCIAWRLKSEKGMEFTISKIDDRYTRITRVR